MKPRLLLQTALSTLALLLSGHALAQSPADGLARCRAVADAAARLACYDALPGPALPAAAPAAAAAAAAPPAQAFGLAAPEEKLQEIVSTIPGLFEGWRPRDLIRLANGQVWQVVDDSRATYRLRDPRVRVKRAPLNGFALDIEGANVVPRVRRVE